MASPRSGYLEIFIKKLWHRVFVTLAEDSLVLSLESQEGEGPALANGSADASQGRGEGGQESYHPEHLPESVTVGNVQALGANGKAAFSPKAHG